MTIQENLNQILNQYDLPHKFLVRFALYCTNDVRHLLEDPISLEVLEIVDKWLDDNVTEKEIAIVHNYAHSTLFDAAYPVDNAIHSLSCTSTSLDNHYWTISTAYWANYTSNKDYAPKLLEMIEELTPLEKMLYRK